MSGDIEQPCKIVVIRPDGSANRFEGRGWSVSDGCLAIYRVRTTFFLSAEPLEIIATYAPGEWTAVFDEAHVGSKQLGAVP